MSEELQSGPVIIPLSAYNVGFGGGVSEEEVNELIENNLDSIKDQIDELSASAGSIKGVTTDTETAIGVEACGSYNGTAIGYNTSSSDGGTAIGYGATANSRAVAIGYRATACDGTPIVIKAKNGDVTLKVTGEGKLLVNDNEIGSGSGSNIIGVTTDSETAIGLSANGLYNGTAIGYNAIGVMEGTAIGYCAMGTGQGTAIGHKANGTTGTVAIGYCAATCEDTRIVIKASNNSHTGDVTLKVTNEGKLLVNDNEIGGGSGSSIIGVTTDGNTAIGKGATVCGNSTAIGYCANGAGYAIAIGSNADSGVYSVAIGSNAKGSSGVVAIGHCADGGIGGVAIGESANVSVSDRIVIKARNSCNNGNVTLKVTDDGKLLVNGNEIGSGGSGSSIEGVTTSIKTAIGYCADGIIGTVAIGYGAKACGDNRIVIKASNNSQLTGDVTLAVTDMGQLKINDNIVAFMSAISALQTCIDGLKSRLNALETT